MEQSNAIAGRALDAARSAASSAPHRIQSVKVKIKFGDKMDAVKKKANSFGAKEKFGHAPSQ